MTSLLNGHDPRVTIMPTPWEVDDASSPDRRNVNMDAFAATVAGHFIDATRGDPWSLSGHSLCQDFVEAVIAAWFDGTGEAVSPRHTIATWAMWLGFAGEGVPSFVGVEERGAMSRMWLLGHDVRSIVDDLLERVP